MKTIRAKWIDDTFILFCKRDGRELAIKQMKGLGYSEEAITDCDVRISDQYVSQCRIFLGTVVYPGEYDK